MSDDVNLTLEDVKRHFPEARETIGKNGPEFNTHCPFKHKAGGYFKLYINAASGMYYCQDCQARGNAVDEWFDYMLHREGYLKLERDNVPRATGAFYAARGEMDYWENGVYAPGKMCSIADLDVTHPAFNYLLERNYRPEEFAMKGHPFEVFYCTKGAFNMMEGKCTTTARIVFPIRMANRLVGWTSRYVDRVVKGANSKTDDRKFVWDGTGWNGVVRRPDGKWADHRIPKYYALPGGEKSAMLYNFDAAKQNPGFVVASEGPLDVQAVGTKGVGYLQNIPSDTHIQLLTRWPTIVWLLDSKGVDTTTKRFERAVQKMSEASRLIWFPLDGYDDPGETPREEIWRQIMSKIQQ